MINNTQLIYPQNNNEVILVIYDLSNGLAKNLSMALVGQYHRAVFHTSIICFNKEYFFGGGIQSLSPYTTGYGQPIEVKKLGSTELDEEIFTEYINSELKTKFNMNSYDLFENNCNHFTNECLEFLLDQKLDDEILNQVKLFKNTPLGNMVGSMFGNFNGDYTNNNSNNPVNFMNNINQNNQTQQSVNKVIWINNFNEFIDKTSDLKLKILYFYSDSCSNCRNLAPFYDEWSNTYTEVTFFKLNINIVREIAIEFKIKSMPTLVFMKDDKEINRIVGFQKEELENYIKTFK